MSPNERWLGAGLERPPAGGAALRALHEREDGMVSLVTIFAVTFLLILAGLVANVGLTIRRKIETQNAADAIAQSTALIRARGMNALTAANHLIGELLALVVLHHAIGGPELDEDQAPPPNEIAREGLRIAHRLAQVANFEFPPNEYIYDHIIDLPRGGATLFRAAVRLQYALAANDGLLTTAGGLMNPLSSAFTGGGSYAAGLAMSGTAKLAEAKIEQERLVLKVLEKLAAGLSGTKQRIDGQVIPGVYKLCGVGTVAQLSLRALPVLEAIKRANTLVDAAVLPTWLTLPVQNEPATIDPIHRSQLVRASYPWVVHWGAPILDFMSDSLTLSGASGYYEEYANRYVLEKAREQKEQRGVNLHVMRGFDPARMNKGEEAWTYKKGENEADHLFGVLAAARREPPHVVSPGIYRQAIPEGLVAYAQAMTYNANPQRRGSGGKTQAIAGWDTLNWGVEVPEYPHEKLASYPQIKLNWQAKLVPVKPRLLLEARVAFASHAEIARAMERVLPIAPLPQFRTH
jgi:hypothetical protein